MIGDAVSAFHEVARLLCAQWSVTGSAIVALPPPFIALLAELFRNPAVSPAWNYAHTVINYSAIGCLGDQVKRVLTQRPRPVAAHHNSGTAGIVNMRTLREFGTRRLHAA